MAVVTTAYYYIAAFPPLNSTSSRLISFSTYNFDAQLFEQRSSRRLFFKIKSNNDESVTSATDAADPETPVEVVPQSLISALNVDRAFRGLAITDADHYGRLGLQTGCSYDQVTTAYKNKVAEVMNRGVDEEDELVIRKEIELLKESHSILSSVEERRMYDWSLARSAKAGADRYVWPFEVDITQTVTGTPPPPEPEDEGPTRLVGYFMLGWLILSFILSIAFYR